MKLNRRLYLMSLFSALFGGRSSSSALGSSNDLLSLADHKQFLLGYVGYFQPPKQFSYSIEDKGTQLFEAMEGKILLRVSSISTKSYNTNLAKNEIDNASNENEFVAIDGNSERLLKIRKSKIEGSDKYFFAEIFVRNVSIIISVVFEYKIVPISDADLIQMLKSLFQSVEICDHQALLVELDRENLNDKSFPAYSTSEEQLSFEAMRTQSSRLCSLFVRNYPPTPEELDKLFEAAVLRPENFNGLDQAKVAIGFAVGDLLVSSLGFRWHYIEDEFGRDLAVVKDWSEGSTRIFPLDFVNKRSSIEDVGFIAEMQRVVMQKFQ